jgi:exosortase/archaeosortase
MIFTKSVAAAVNRQALAQVQAHQTTVHLAVQVHLRAVAVVVAAVVAVLHPVLRLAQAPVVLVPEARVLDLESDCYLRISNENNSIILDKALHCLFYRYQKV